ncbi:MAG: LrgB family protein, partial [Lachnospiraceae bacterium]|nr:LrgB family protein [Lachnospiraceae bacterium]
QKDRNRKSCLRDFYNNITAERICRLLKTQNSISRGLAIGAASHVIGTSKAMEIGETEGAMSNLAVVVSGVCTVLFSKFY